MIEAFGDDAKRQGLNFCDRLVAILAIAEDTAEGGHFSEPASVVFLFEFNRKRHVCTVTFAEVGQQGAGRDPVRNRSGAT